MVLGEQGPSIEIFIGNDVSTGIANVFRGKVTT